jgi:ribosomal-protein-alanine N-acetyltransferase
MKPLIFETARLRAHRIGPEDVDAMFGVYGDAQAMRWVGDGNPLTRAECEKWIRVTLKNYEARGYGMFALLDHESAEIIGFCGLVHPGGQTEAEIKYALKRSFWGKGLATEAVTALLAWAADRLGINHVIATVDPENMASRRVLVKAGLRAANLRTNDDGSVTQIFEWNASPSDADR